MGLDDTGADAGTDAGNAATTMKWLMTRASRLESPHHKWATVAQTHKGIWLKTDTVFVNKLLYL